MTVTQFFSLYGAKQFERFLLKQFSGNIYRISGRLIKLEFGIIFTWKILYTGLVLSSSSEARALSKSPPLANLLLKSTPHLGQNEIHVCFFWMTAQLIYIPSSITYSLNNKIATPYFQKNLGVSISLKLQDL